MNIHVRIVAIAMRMAEMLSNPSMEAEIANMLEQLGETDGPACNLMVAALEKSPTLEH